MKSFRTWIEKLARFLNIRRISILLTVLYAASLLPLLMLSQYDYASADDYSTGAANYHIWQATHSIGAVLMRAAQMAVEFFLQWEGYFTSIFLTALQPGLFGAHVYRVTPWIMLFMLTFSAMYLLRCICVKALGMDRYATHAVTMLLLMISIQCLVGRVEILYWYAGACNYTFYYAAGMIFFGLLLSFLFDRKKGKRIFDMIAACLLGFGVGGGNYMTSLSTAIVLSIFLAVLLLTHSLAKYKGVLIPAAFFATAFCAACSAPGNAVREEGLSGNGPVKAIVLSLYYFFDLCVSDWTTWPVMAGLLLMLPFFWKMARSTKFTFPHPLLVLFLAYGVVSANVTPPLYAVGNIIAGRLQGLFFLQYVLLMTLSLLYGTGALVKYMERSGVLAAQGEKAADMHFTAPVFGAFAGLVLFTGFGSALCVGVDPYYYTTTAAITDLCNGSAQAYGAAWEERLQILEDPMVKEVRFHELPYHPELLFFTDITADPEDWTNRALAQYFEKDSVVLEK